MINQTPVEFAAQLWCRPENGHRIMDVDFAQSIADAVAPIMKERDRLRGEVEMDIDVRKWRAERDGNFWKTIEIDELWKRYDALVLRLAHVWLVLQETKMVDTPEIIISKLEGILTYKRGRITELENNLKELSAPRVQEMDGVIKGKAIRIHASPNYTILTVDGLELYFNIEDGKYDGWGEVVG